MKQSPPSDDDSQEIHGVFNNRRFITMPTELVTGSCPGPHEFNPHSSVGMALGYGLDNRGSRFRFPAGAGNFSLHHRVQNGSGARPIQWVKRPGREADHLPPSRAEINEYVKLYFYTPNTPLWRSARLKEQYSDNFTFTFTFTLKPYFLKVCFNIILLSTPTDPKLSRPLRVIETNRVSTVKN
jgi:hypothetical protein